MGYYIEQKPVRLSDPVTDASNSANTPTPTDAEIEAMYNVGRINFATASCEDVLTGINQNRKAYRNGAVIATAICAWLGHRLYKKFK